MKQKNYDTTLVDSLIRAKELEVTIQIGNELESIGSPIGLPYNKISELKAEIQALKKDREYILETGMTKDEWKNIT